MQEKRPFEGIRVLDLTHVLAGPFAAYQLAVMGAEVIKIENPRNPDQVRDRGTDLSLHDRGMGTYFLTQGSNKKTMTLDLKSSEGKAAFLKLVETADVLIENYRPGAFESLGLGYADLKEVNPTLIYCSMSGFGHTGPRRTHTAYDQVIQALSGVMMMTGTPQASPVLLGAPMIDYSTGMTGAFAIASALFQRSATGKGQWIDLSMLDVALTMMSSHVTGYFQNGTVPKPKGYDYPLATMACYPTADGLITLGASSLQQQRDFWNAVGRPDLIKESNAERLRAHDEEAEVIREILATKPAAEWERYLQENHIPAGRVRTLDEALSDPQLESRNVIFQHEGGVTPNQRLTVPVAAFRFEHGGPKVDALPREVGSDTDDILMSLGFTESDIAAMRKAQAI